MMVREGKPPTGKQPEIPAAYLGARERVGHQMMTPEERAMIERARKYAALTEKATPGSWRVNTPYDLPSIDEPNYSIISGDCNDSGAALALAAAAPDMAELLAEMADALEKCLGNDDRT